MPTGTKPKEFFERICNSGNHTGTTKLIAHSSVCIIPHPDQPEMVVFLAFLNDEREEAQRMEEAANDGFQGDTDALHDAILEKYEPGAILLWLLHEAHVPKNDIGFLDLMRKKPVLQLILPALESSERDKVHRGFTSDPFAQNLVMEILALREKDRQRPAASNL